MESGTEKGPVVGAVTGAGPREQGVAPEEGVVKAEPAEDGRTRECDGGTSGTKARKQKRRKPKLAFSLTDKPDGSASPSGTAATEGQAEPEHQPSARDRRGPAGGKGKGRQSPAPGPTADQGRESGGGRRDAADRLPNGNAVAHAPDTACSGESQPRDMPGSAGKTRKEKKKEKKEKKRKEEKEKRENEKEERKKEKREKEKEKKEKLKQSGSSGPLDGKPSSASSGTPARADNGSLAPHDNCRTPTKRDGRGQQQRTPRSQKWNDTGTPRGKKNFKPFDDYLSLEAVSDGLKRKELLQGSLRINPRNYEESYIDSQNGGADILISGTHARNRALEGDVVTVRLLPKSTWRLLEDDYTAYQRKQPKGPSESKTTKSVSVDPAGPSLTGQLQSLTLDDSTNSAAVESDGAIAVDAVASAAVPETQDEAGRGAVAKRLFPDEGEAAAAGSREAIPDRFFQRLGEVVYVVEKRHSGACSGFLKPPTCKQATDALFSPTDHRMPRIYVPLRECPDGFLERPGDFEKTLFIARLEEWPKNSVIARGHLHRSLGEAGEIEPETEGMLIEHGVDYSDFSQEVVDCLPKNLPWTIPQDEIARRRDFRDRCIFTIDPSTARDLDDALSCIPLADGVYEVGVHIADVSFFVEEGNELDRVAGQRATSVYLVQKVIPMLPRLLCEHLCSLNPNEDKLTFSFLWKLSECGEILEEWCGRSVIRSCAKMSYEHAQGFIEEPERAWRTEELPPIAGGFGVPQIVQTVLNLNKIAQGLRKKRTEDGALRLDQVKLQFALERESGLPSGYSVYKQRDSNKLVEEFMLLANMAAAHRVHDSHQDTAMLRRHPPPKAKLLEDLVETCRQLGLAVDGASSKALQDSLARYLGPRDDARAWGMGQILTVLYSKPMQRAKYFCTGTLEDEFLYRHYALNVPLYTHFTSPIRRYADIIVHRQLAASLGLMEISARDMTTIEAQATRCNERKEAAKEVSRLSSEMFFAIFVRECGPLEEDAMIMQVLDHSVDVLVLNLGVVKRVYCNALPLKSFKFSKQGKQASLTIVWQADDSKRSGEETQVLQLFSSVRVELKSANEPLKYTASIIRPDQD